MLTGVKHRDFQVRTASSLARLETEPTRYNWFQVRTASSLARLETETTRYNCDATVKPNQFHFKPSVST